ncbi:MULTISPECIES: hypothetical protein [Halocynthiibacter]|uniref:Autotransporter domain-containing protein n=1 Tax=Halocynthiibacter halioticoli TaxID=2986804 RepID=A0AAE3IY10_9RHOB|nr:MULTISPECIES: hypothetical protein [Halocynthiibacter]MCV6822996.1 hypothetical protein [Halocynthiibacter halioticoli]MCW4055997.1 hypothetical protein [Halocynthiibacter sp. SDUM655004]
MKRYILAITASFTISTAHAQSMTGWSTQVDGLTSYQSDTKLDDGNEFTATRSFLRVTGLNTSASGTAVGLSVSLGQFDYEFANTATQPWTDIQDIRLAVPVRFKLDSGANVFLAPSIRWDYQQGVDASDGQTYGVFGGISWKVRDNLTIGPAFGAFTQIGNDDLELFPALLIDWDITDRLNLTTGSGLGATQGPGLTLKYATTDTTSVGLTARSESVRFRLDDKGIAPSGVGEDQSYPVVVSFEYSPNPGLSFSAFAGAEFGGELALETTSGKTVSKQSYDTAPIAGLAFRLRF